MTDEGRLGRAAQEIAHLREENTRWRKSLDFVPSIIVTIDLLGTITHANRQACELFGYRLHECVGKNWYDCFFSQETRDRVKFYIRKLVNGDLEELRYFETPMLTRLRIPKVIAWRSLILNAKILFSRLGNVEFLRSQPVKTILGLVLTLALGSVLNAGPIIHVGDSLRFYNQEGNVGGGEFGVAILPDNTELFRTFCLERTEAISFDKNGLIVAGITDTVQLGSTGVGDPLDPKTAYLYDAFLKKTLVTPYDYTPGSAQHVSDANDLQLAIWAIEQEPGVILTAKAQAFIDEATAAGWTSTGSVSALNMMTPSGAFAQDVLYVIPEPSVMILMGLGLVGIGIARRRR